MQDNTDCYKTEEDSKLIARIAVGIMGWNIYNQFAPDASGIAILEESNWPWQFEHRQQLILRVWNPLTEKRRKALALAMGMDSRQIYWSGNSTVSVLS